ncbi:acyltransferase [Bacillus sp. ISL-55]|uniref:acyltransferase n=1 Tax=Bacillus sp. ISL-55 TaxID=2819134 RepID=UPI001BEC8764|nr:acyltransferase [Bacillus sp. ISL-55]MBT2694471.1 acyltransferase [Bacillus sp. ISL-55]
MIFSKIKRVVTSIVKSLMVKIIYKDKISLQTSYTINWRTEIKAIGNGKILIGKNLHTRDGCSITSSANLSIGNKVFFNRNCIIACRNNIKIGDGCAFGPNVCIYDHDHSFSSEGMIPGEYKYDNVIIGKNCWIGAGAIILKGTTIGDNCVIGAGAIIKGNIPNNSLAITEKFTRVTELR